MRMKSWSVNLSTGNVAVLTTGFASAPLKASPGKFRAEMVIVAEGPLSGDDRNVMSGISREANMN
jgi:hypothetical protein